MRLRAEMELGFGEQELEEGVRDKTSMFGLQTGLWMGAKLGIRVRDENEDAFRIRDRAEVGIGVWVGVGRWLWEEGD